MGIVVTALGPVESDELGQVLAAEVLLHRPASGAAGAGLPASDAVFARSAVTMEMLGRLMMGAENLDDATLGVSDARGALRCLAEASMPDSAAPVVVAFGGIAGPVGVDFDADAAEVSAEADAAAFAELSRASGVHIVRGGTASQGAGVASGGRDSIGIVGLVSPHDEPECAAAAAFARERGLALAVRVGAAGVADTVAGLDARFAEVSTALEHADRAGLPRTRVVLVGAQRLLGARLGVDEGRLEQLIDLGTAICFDDLGRIPTVHTVISDHDLAVTVLRSAELGAGDRVMLSCGIAQKHRLAAFGGNGLEFVSSQFLPYLRMLGADEALLAGVGRKNALSLIERRAAS